MKNKLFYWCAVMALVFLCLPVTAFAVDNEVGVAYRGHIQDRGDYPADGSWVNSPEIIGTVGQSKRIEGFEIKLTGTVPDGMELRYNVHVQNKGWLYDENDPADWPRNGEYAGTRGKSLRIEAVKIVLTDSAGKAVTGYSVQYRGHVQNVGDLPADKSQWLADGAQLGTVGSSLRLEALLVQVVKTGTDPVGPTEPTVYDKAGTYGPKQGSETIAGDVTVAADGVVLQNLVIAGNLTISETVGDGNVTLNNVTVKGDTFVRGGGVHSIKINGGEYSRIIMEKTASGAVRIMALNVEGIPIFISEAAAGETIILEGAFESVTVNAPNMTVTTQGNTTTIGTMTVSAAAAGSTVTVAAGTTVSDLVLDGKAAVKGQGTVAKAEVKVDGVVFDKKPGAVTVEPGVVIPPVFPTPDSGGGGYNPPAPIAVTGISLNKTASIVSFNDKETLVATVAPADATNKAVSWTTSDDTIATVDAAGQVTGSANTEGKATITATSADGAKMASCTVTVTRFKVTKTTEGIGMITGINGNSTDITIPETIGGLTITAIGDGAFQSTAIVKVTIPKTVKTIDSSAFANCYSLQMVSFTMDSSLETIGAYAFAGSRVGDMTLPATLTTIENNAFSNCNSLQDITIPAGVTVIPDQAFSGCSHLYTVTLPSGLTAIGAEAFKNCSVLTDITIPKGVISIGSAAFDFDADKAPASRSYTFRGDVPGMMGAEAGKINPGAVIPTTSTPKIRYYANYDGFTAAAWNGYTKAVILTQPGLNPLTATNTGTPAVELSWGTVANASFYEVSVCEEGDPFTGTPITIAGGTLNTRITDNLISGKTYKFAVKARDEYGESLLSQVKSVTIPYPIPVTGLAISAFPSSLYVGSMGQLSATFTPTTATHQKVSWSSLNTGIAMVDADTGVITAVAPGVVTMQGITEDGGFKATCLVTVTLVQVQSVTLDQETLSVGVSKTAQLTAKVEPANAQVLSVTWASDDESIATVDATGQVTGNKEGSANIIVTASDLAGSQSASCAVTVTTSFQVTKTDEGIGTITGMNGSSTDIAIPETIGGLTITAIRYEAFKNTAIKKVTIPKTVKEIGSRAFADCGSLDSVSFATDSNLETIGDGAFSNSSISTVAIPKTVKTIGSNAFYNCIFLKLVSFPTDSNLATIGTAAFADSSVASMTLPDKVTAIPDQAFSGCRNLYTVTLPSGLTAIGAEAFKNCSALTDITIPKEVKTINADAFGFDADKVPASRSYTFRGDVPTTMTASPIPTTPQPTIKYYANYHGYDGWAGCSKAIILAQPTQKALQISNTGTPATPVVTLNWDPVANATAYDIFVSNTTGTYDVVTQTVTGGGTTTTDITGLDSSKTYYFVIKARDDYGESLLSDEMKADLNIKVADVSVEVDSATIHMGITAQLKATIIPANATNQKVVWSSLTPGIATVDANGIITPVKPGEATMQGTTDDGGHTATCPVTVAPN